MGKNTIMGTGIKVKCKDCGTLYYRLSGVGFSGIPVKPEDNVCPNCGSKKWAKVKEDDIKILWD